MNLPNRKIMAWAMYDWANSAFATTVMAGFFPIFFKQYWSAGADVTESTFQLGVSNSVASIIVVLMAPLLGAIADRAGAKKKFLFLFALLGICMTGGLYFVAKGDWFIAALFYIAATLGFMGGNVFYDALLVTVAEPDQREMVSAIGFAVGYLGGGLLFFINVMMTQQPEWFGLANAAEAVRLSFITVAVWWMVFALPLLFLVPENKPGGQGNGSVSIGFRQLMDTFRQIRLLRNVFIFLVAYWLYIDGVDTIVRMAVDYGLSIGFDTGDLIQALLITQFVGFPAALVFGKLGTIYSARAGIYLALFTYIAITGIAYQMDTVWEFYLLAVLIGLVQGGIQALSRSLYSRIIPQDKAGEFFGFYNMMGKFAAVLGPLLMAWVGVATGNPRYAILSVSVLFIAGGVLLYFVREDDVAVNLENKTD